MSGGMSSAQVAVLTERRAYALSLRKGGASFRAIAAKIAADPRFDCPNYCFSQASRDISHCLRELSEQTLSDATELVQLEEERLDDLYLRSIKLLDAANAYTGGIQQFKRLLNEADGAIDIADILPSLRRAIAQPGMLDGMAMQGINTAANALRQALAVRESYRRLKGLDKPARIEVQRSLEQELTAFLNALEKQLQPEVYEQVLKAYTQIEESHDERN